MSSDNVKKIRDKNTFRYVLRNPPTSDIAYVHRMRDYARLDDARRTSRNLISRKTLRSVVKHSLRLGATPRKQNGR